MTVGFFSRTCHDRILGSLHAFAQFHQSSIEGFDVDQSEAGMLDIENT
jgi:hypothetical protein